jgi:hypothetical protein
MRARAKVLLGILLIRLPIALALIWLGGHLATETTLRSVPFIKEVLGLIVSVPVVWLVFGPFLRMQK